MVWTTVTFIFAFTKKCFLCLIASWYYHKFILLLLTLHFIAIIWIRHHFNSMVIGNFVPYINVTVHVQIQRPIQDTVKNIIYIHKILNVKYFTRFWICLWKKAFNTLTFRNPLMKILYVFKSNLTTLTSDNILISQPIFTWCYIRATADRVGHFCNFSYFLY